MKLQQVITMAFLVGSLLMVGCKNIAPVTSGSGAEKLAQGDDFSQHLKIDNPDLGKKLYISDLKSRKTNELLEVSLALTSRYKKSLQLQHHFIWFDVDGFVIEPNKTPWQPVTLHGYQTATLRGVAPTAAVASFSAYVREVPKKAYKF